MGRRGQFPSVSLEDILGNAAGFDAGTAVDEVDFAVVEHQRVLIATVRGASSQASLQDGIERSDEQRHKAAGLASGRFPGTTRLVRNRGAEPMRGRPFKH